MSKADNRKNADAHAHDAVSLVDDLLERAVQAGVSDVHFEPTAKSMIVRFRLDGLLTDIEALPKAMAENVVARLKVLGHLLTYRSDIPQEGRIEMQDSTGRLVDRRLAVFPTIYGQRAVVRLFYDEPALAELEHLGFSDAILAAIQETAAATQGVLLLTGPAGSGKSTTLAAILRHIVTRCGGRSVVTLEDPVERRLDGVTQVQITQQGELTFPTALRSLLRQDPQVLMIGEIRDAETARIAIEAALTGHLLMSTMHSGTPAGALLRLLEMGIEPYQVTSSISVVINQRLVRRLCGDCKCEGDHGTFGPAGCEKCLQTGFRGRALITEMVRLDGDLRKAILAKADLDELRAILDARGHMTMLHDGQRLVAKGITTQEEVEKVCGPAR